ncbi:aspartate/glutamate racemase family protein [Paraburkholderia silvatlantica]|uniref:Asp/Glu/hydantoin racemase n=1 Tax=Paraburkholderia silvatlantica TaxID=321895 RepID=A0A2U1ABL5_9BURK|nr:aspartate/glutamate racemase family protein [Paraburkholderia silvatlantica]MBB2930308.1 Asp/Glu/hydantoin racemase [Paraburkholderia silvatlantica]PVY32138.1 Asp/Glu/hydantoin racemase [Paraburkholderia silvatlantica]PXW37758.1 Asp/Glu/hydantoin racemase [Paraburkholderia silvatlantica]PYE25579.1 Asp/Glu/hydantoin racemase [Paraburkholderia silvatlantica]TDQ97778.1 Asp/Glu/hydantoin racemase [Paraburkholderia silvatlantica]
MTLHSLPDNQAASDARELRPRRRTIHGVSIGILMLDTGFQRLPGDIGHGATWSFPVQYGLVTGVTGPQVMAATSGEEKAAVPLIERFVEAALQLVDLGVDGITTSCGFLVAFQQALTERCAVPVATSALLQIPSVAMLLPKRQRVGVLTARAASLTPRHLLAANAPTDLPVAGLREDSQFFRNNLENAPTVNFDEQAADLLECAERLLSAHPETGAIISECSNFAPYSALISERFGVPVFDIVTMVEWFQAGLRPKRFQASFQAAL